MPLTGHVCPTRRSARPRPLDWLADQLLGALEGANGGPSARQREARLPVADPRPKRRPARRQDGRQRADPGDRREVLARSIGRTCSPGVRERLVGQLDGQAPPAHHSGAPAGHREPARRLPMAGTTETELRRSAPVFSSTRSTPMVRSPRNPGPSWRWPGAGSNRRPTAFQIGDVLSTRVRGRGNSEKSAPAAPVRTCLYEYELRRKLRRPASNKRAGANGRRTVWHRCTVTAKPFT